MYAYYLARSATATLMVLLALLISACGDENGVEPGQDTVPPARIVNMRVDSTSQDFVCLSWTAPGDDDNSGTASSYDIRYATDSTTLLGWTNATVVTGIADPATAGSKEMLTLSPLPADSIYFFGIRSIDETDNVSATSNMAFGSLLEGVATNITLTFHSYWGIPLDSLVLPVEGSITIGTGSIPGDLDPCYVNARASGFFSEIYFGLPGETIVIDLDAVPQLPNSMAGVIHVTGGNSGPYYGWRTLAISGPQGMSEVVIDQQGRYIVVNVPTGLYTIADSTCYLSQFELTNTDSMDYTDIACYGVQIDAPNIYLYPETEMDVTVTLGFPSSGHVIESQPPYGNGWQVHVTTDGIIDGTYEYLFYEAVFSASLNRETGWLLDGDDLKGEFRRLLAQYGFIGREIDDFVDYWVPVLEGSPWYTVYPQEIESMVTLDISPAPDNLLRMLLLIQPFQQPLSITPPPDPQPFERNGFVAVEWGVVHPSIAQE